MSERPFERVLGHFVFDAAVGECDIDLSRGGLTQHLDLAENGRAVTGLSS